MHLRTLKLWQICDLNLLNLPVRCHYVSDLWHLLDEKLCFMYMYRERNYVHDWQCTCAFCGTGTWTVWYPVCPLLAVTVTCTGIVCWMCCAGSWIGLTCTLSPACEKYSMKYLELLYNVLNTTYLLVAEQFVRWCPARLKWERHWISLLN